MGAFKSLSDAKLLYHQVRTADALQQAALVVNSYNTGTGKTRASLLHLFALGQRRHNVLFIAPTNALICQHVEDIQTFVRNHNLRFRVIEVNADVLRRLGVDLAVASRNGEKLHRLLRNPMEFHHDLGIAPDDHRPLPFIIVVNPDIFHYMLFFRYGGHDQRNLFDDALKTFWYVVIDEFHYYDEKQLVSFLAFLTLWQGWKFFDEGRKVCLLSATPNPQIEAYLTNILGADWKHISPDNEPPESANYEEVQTLSELDLSISDMTLNEWLTRHRTDLNAWLSADEDGAIISNSLARINEAYDQLNTLDVWRITGPEPPEQRAQALHHQLLLATPVVDIGYNFDKDKQRQNIDFIVCEGRFRDDLVQRIGRAGRVLGKEQHDHLSRAVVLVNAPAADVLRPYDGQTLDRRQFRDLLHSLEQLPPKHSLDAYIRIHGMTEALYPIYRAGKIMLPDEADVEIERLYERIRSIFAPNSRRPYKSFRFFYQSFDNREKWWHRKEGEKWRRDEYNGPTLVSNLASWLTKLRSDSGKEIAVSTDEAKDLLAQVLANTNRREGLGDFIASQYHLTKSLFAFRDSFNGPEAVLYDDHGLFSSQKHNSYDLLHLVANYNLHLYSSHQEYETYCGTTERRGDFYVRLLSRLPTRLKIGFSLDSESANQAQFNHRYCRCPVSMKGINLTTSEIGGGPKPLQPVIQDAILDIYVTMLIVSQEDQGMLIRTLRNTPLIARPMIVRFANGSQGEYSVVAGSAAWHAEAALQGFLQMRRRREPCEAIFV
jgi:CRISPR-associated endonuclease/helicase Cas3